MATEASSSEPDDDDQEKTLPEQNGTKNSTGQGENIGQEEGEEDEEEDQDEDEEPRLKYASLTKNLSSLYRNGDATSSCTVGGDKLHVFSLPTWRSLRVYSAHTAGVSSISISPFPPPLPSVRAENTQKVTVPTSEKSTSVSQDSPNSKQSPRQLPIPPIPSNQIYIGTSSIDGNVCVQSLIDPKDVLLRNFGRPVQAVALSPEYKADRNYLSGGVAGSLILTSGGQIGRSAHANVGSAAAVASGWLGSIGVGANTGSDKVLHSGEGAISTIKWSLSGKYVVWVNEYGIKIMRSNLRLESADSGFEWKRMSHIDRPSSAGWEEMAAVWKARAEWIDRDNVESDDDPLPRSDPLFDTNGDTQTSAKTISERNKAEEALVGWGGTIWLIRVQPGGAGSGKNVGERSIGRVEVITRLRTDCIISGISLYTPNLLVVLAYNESQETSKKKEATGTSTRKGRQHKQNALEPELRLIAIDSQEEISTDTLTVSRYEGLSASDYHLGVLPPMKVVTAMTQKSTLEAIGTGLWDASLYPTKIFSSGVSVQSVSNIEEKASSKAPSGTYSSLTQQKDTPNIGSSHGMRIFVLSPFDCIVAIKRDLADRLTWLNSMGQYEQAWRLLDEHPEAIGTTSEASEASSTQTSKPGSVAHGLPRANTSLADFFADTASTASPSNPRSFHSAAEKEKRRIGDLWLQQTVSSGNWALAGEIAAKVLQTSTRWEHWAWIFIRNNKFDEITPYLPTFQITPPLPSLIYEVSLGHYIVSDIDQFAELLDQWPSDLFDVSSITTAIEDKLRSHDTKEGSREWRLLTEYLAKLFLAGGRYDDALRCYMRVQDAETALSMLREHHLLDEVSDDIPNLVLLRISKEQLKSGNIDELAEASSEPIKLLVEGARNGNVSPEIVITQLEESKYRLFLFFYLKALWVGDGVPTSAAARTSRSTSRALAQDEGKALVEQFADLAVELFAEYDRETLMEFLQSSTAYRFDSAVKVCEQRHYTSELVFLLSKTGEMKKALFLIIDDLNDVSRAISFAKEQDDPDLWDDLLEYSMSRPRFIEGLLAEVGTAIDPITLVKRIPSGLEIEGLRDGLKKMIREYDLQDSISTGVAKVLQGEVAVGMERLRQGQRRGIKFDLLAPSRAESTLALSSSGQPKGAVESATEEKTPVVPSKLDAHLCVGCSEPFTTNESDILVGFACGHVFHLSHLLESPPSMLTDENEDENAAARSLLPPRSVSQKVTNARLLKESIASAGGCKVCSKREKQDDELSPR
ncbi:MAG: hypothetical protein Q9227_005106 [Pyrenula ochraceoflavens]